MKTILRLNVELVPDPYIQHDMTFAQINAETEESKNAWLQKQGLEQLWSSKELTTMGYAQGGMASMFRSRLLAKPYDSFGTYYCPYFQGLEINVIYRTLIRMPSDMASQCEHDIVMAHEMRHHKANLDSFALYMKQLEKDLPHMVAYYERTPIKRSLVDAQFESMKVAIEDAVKLYIREYAVKEAAKINDQIDSPESYAEDAKKIEACRAKTR